nr:hypothetical protein [Sphingomonas profundi]
MDRRHALDLSNTAPCQFGCARNAYARIAQADDPAVMSNVGFAAGIATCPLGKLNPFALAFAPSFVI